jgi:hypothetical protein
MKNISLKLSTYCIGSVVQWKAALHQHRYGLLLHISSALPYIQYYLLVECGGLEIQHLEYLQPGGEGDGVMHGQLGNLDKGKK